MYTKLSFYIAYMYIYIYTPSTDNLLTTFMYICMLHDYPSFLPLNLILIASQVKTNRENYNFDFTNRKRKLSHGTLYIGCIYKIWRLVVSEERETMWFIYIYRYDLFMA